MATLVLELEPAAAGIGEPFSAWPPPEPTVCLFHPGPFRFGALGPCATAMSR
ncbi:MAG: hypothetical protein ACOVOT_03055 [Rubrivivax sp.]|jgi:hypothetical protein